MKHIRIAVILPLLLAACTSAEERAEQRKLQIEQDIVTCESYGLKQGSEAFGNCRLQLDLARDRRFNAPYFYGGYGGYYRGGSHIGIGRGF